jgi:DNA-binding transcriptional MerR regulator
VLRFWESRFTQIRPLKRGGGRRYYRPDDVDLLRGVRHLLYGEGYTIRGVQRILREEGLSYVQSVWRTGAKDLPAVDFPDEDETAAADLEGEADADDIAEGEDESEDENTEVEAAVRPREPSFFSEPPTSAMRPDERREPTLVPQSSLPQSSLPQSSHGPQSSAVPLAAAPARLSADSQSRQKLEAALDELIACRRLIQAVLTDTPLPPERSDEAG